MLTRRGIVLSATVLGTALTAKAVSAAPAGLLGTIATAALSGSTISTATVIAATKTVTMTTLQKVAVATTFAVVAGAGIQQAYQAARLRGQMQTLQQQRTSMGAQIQQLQRERDDAANRPAVVEKTNDAELLKLRAEVAALRAAAREQTPVDPVTRDWSARIATLKQKLGQMPDKRIPEMAFQKDADWATVTRDVNVDTDEQARQALSHLRSAAKDHFLDAMREAFKKYAMAVNGGELPKELDQLSKVINANPNLLPADLAQLKPYFDQPVDDELLQRYQFKPPTKFHDNLSDIMVKETAPPVDAEYDTHHEIGWFSSGLGQVNLIQDAVNAAAKDYSQANSGQTPTDPAQVAPYLKSPLDAALVQKYLSRLPAATAAK